jgi:serine/threonine protein kinase
MTMSDQATPAEPLAPSPSETGKARRDTVVLSEVPDATALSSPPADLAASDQHRGPDPRSEYGSGALAVLSQRYQILAEVGRGDLCIVYKAHDKETGNTVALKLLRSDVAFDPASLERFKSDVLLAGGITHPNICRIFDVHLLKNTACASMHFVEGESLRLMLNRSGTLPLRKGIDLTVQICAGLAEAHGFGIVHGDLKPENVMVGPHGTAKITDFLFATLRTAARRITGRPTIASPYTAPERAEGKPLDRWADIYSLGVVLHEIFTGKLPVSMEGADGAPSKQAPERPRLPREVDTAIPVSLERVILKCIEEDPAKRYQTVAELESDLSSSGIRAILPSGSGFGTRTTLSNREAIAHPDAVPLSTPRPQPRSFSIRSVPILGILLGAFAILAVLGAFQVASILRSARSIAPPSALPAPHPPGFALEKSAPASSRSQSARLQFAPSDEIPPPPASPKAPDAFPESSGALEIAPPGAAKTPGREHAAQDAGGANYLWIARFDLQSGAQGMANEIEGLGLPAIIVPRHNPKGDFFVVLSGPFSPSKASAALDELQAEGFANLHVIKNLTLSQ